MSRAFRNGRCKTTKPATPFPGRTSGKSLNSPTRPYRNSCTGSRRSRRSISNLCLTGSSEWKHLSLSFGKSVRCFNGSKGGFQDQAGPKQHHSQRIQDEIEVAQINRFAYSEIVRHSSPPDDG